MMWGILMNNKEIIYTKKDKEKAKNIKLILLIHLTLYIFINLKFHSIFRLSLKINNRFC